MSKHEQELISELSEENAMLKSKLEYQGQAMPEPITRMELIEIAEVHAAEVGFDVYGEGGMIEQLESAYITKFPTYITGGPGYFGPVYLILWDGSPDYVSVVREEHIVGQSEKDRVRKLIITHYGDF